MPVKQTIAKSLRRNFVSGLLVFAPLAATLGVLFWVVEKLDNLLLPPLVALVTGAEEPQRIPLLGALFTLGVILLVGVITRRVFGRRAVRFAERQLQRVPLARSIYNAVKQISENIFSADGSQLQSAFQRAVLVEYPRRGVWAIAFTTGEKPSRLHDFSDEELVHIFVPTTPNPTSGFFLLVPRADLRDVNLSVEQAFKLVISAGIATPESEAIPEPQPPVNKEQP